MPRFPDLVTASVECVEADYKAAIAAHLAALVIPDGLRVDSRGHLTAPEMYYPGGKHAWFAVIGQAKADEFRAFALNSVWPTLVHESDNENGPFASNGVGWLVDMVADLIDDGRPWVGLSAEREALAKAKKEERAARVSVLKAQREIRAAKADLKASKRAKTSE